MKILQINATYGYGSTGRNVQETHDYLTKRGIESYVAWATANSESVKDNAIFRVGNTLDHKIHAIQARLVGKQGFYSHNATRALCKKIEHINPDVVHLHNLHSNYIDLEILLSFLKEKRYPVLITLHDCWFFTGGCYHYYRRECDRWKNGCGLCSRCKGIFGKTPTGRLLEMRKYNFGRMSKLGVVGVSDWIANEAKESILNSADYIRTIYNWVNMDIFKPIETEGLEVKLNISDKKVILGVSQGWSTNKGLSEMMQIAETLGNEVRVILIGGIDKYIKLPKNILTIGFVAGQQELAKYYSMADVFVNPSRMETFGKVIAEAMACGTPVVAYGNTGMAELIKEGCGYVTEDGNISDMIEKVKMVINMDKKIFSGKCVNHARSEFNMEKQIEKYIEAYRDLLEARNRSK